MRFAGRCLAFAVAVLSWPPDAFSAWLAVREREPLRF
jgi:hypothetical protein